MAETNSKYTITDTKINVAYNNMTEHDVRLFVVRMGIYKDYNQVMQMKFSSIDLTLANHGYNLIREKDAMGYKGKNSKQIIKNADGPDVDIYFFELLEMNYSQLNDMLNDYLDLYNAFNEYRYRMNALIIMEAINTKKAKEVNVS